MIHEFKIEYSECSYHGVVDTTPCKACFFRDETSLPTLIKLKKQVRRICSNCKEDTSNHYFNHYFEGIVCLCPNCVPTGELSKPNVAIEGLVEVLREDIENCKEGNTERWLEYFVWGMKREHILFHRDLVVSRVKGKLKQFFEQGPAPSRANRSYHALADNVKRHIRLLTT